MNDISSYFVIIALILILLAGIITLLGKSSPDTYYAAIFFMIYSVYLKMGEINK